MVTPAARATTSACALASAMAAPIALRWALAWSERSALTSARPVPVTTIVLSGATPGVPALAAFLWFLGKMLWDFLRAARRLGAEEGERRFVLYGALAVMIALLSAGWYEHNLNDGHILPLFLAVCGCGYLAVGAEKSELRSDGQGGALSH